mmetsp:Transcript_44215/g.122936  ORF Transcript_44215/g.122936 Transcript_44215/m.122936 type:complete len:247 (-) Transcript_44215:39-779(-)
MPASSHAKQVSSTCALARRRWPVELLSRTMWPVLSSKPHRCFAAPPLHCHTCGNLPLVSKHLKSLVMSLLGQGLSPQRCSFTVALQFDWVTMTSPQSRHMPVCLLTSFPTSKGSVASLGRSAGMPSRCRGATRPASLVGAGPALGLGAGLGLGEAPGPSASKPCNSSGSGAAAGTPFPSLAATVNTAAMESKATPSNTATQAAAGTCLRRRHERAAQVSSENSSASSTSSGIHFEAIPVIPRIAVG